MAQKIIISLLAIFLTIQITEAKFHQATIQYSHKALTPSSKTPFLFSSNKQHKITILSHGIASLIYRLALIQSAKENIELENYIFAPGLCTELLLKALAQKAKEGVKVQILIDAAGRIKEQKNNINNLRHATYTKGIQLKLFNANLLEWNYRNHRKLLCIDSGERGCIIGGSNMMDRYFDMDFDTFNHLDRDILIEGEINTKISNSFKSYWNSSYSSFPVSNYTYNLKKQYIPKRLSESLQDQSLLEMHNFTRILKTQFNKISTNTNYIQKGNCSSIQFVTDLPGKSQFKNSRVGDIFLQTINKAQKTIFLETPVFILNYTPMRQSFHKLFKRGIKIKLLTLGGEADNFTVGITNIDSIQEYSARGMDVFARNHDLIRNRPRIHKEFSNTPFLMHSKAALIDSLGDNPLLWISSFNLDPRSYKYNAELGIVCTPDKSLSKQLHISMEQWQQNATYLDKKSGAGYLPNKKKPKKKLKYFLIKQFKFLY